MSTTPAESAVHELTNIRNMTHSKSNFHSNTDDSPSSKAKRWTTRFTKFQRNSDKKKKESPIISQPLQLNTTSLFQRSVSTKSLNDAFKTPTTEQTQQHNYPFRTSSLPRPTSHLYTPHKITYPKTAPLGEYVNNEQSTFTANIGLQELSEGDITPKQNSSSFSLPSSLSTKEKRSFVRERCTLCNELISNKSNGERIIELECKHLCHEECLSVSMDNLSTTESSDFHTMFPQCSKCFEEKNQIRQSIPKNDDLKDRLLSHILIHKSATSPTTFQAIDTPLQPAYSPLSTPINQIQSQIVLQQTPNSLVPNQELLDFPLAEPPIRRRPLNSIPNDARLQNWKLSHISPKIHNAPKHNQRNHSLYLPNLGRINSSLDSDMISMTTTNTTTVNPEETNQLPIIRSYFIQILLENFKTSLVDWKLDDEFGILRLVDKLMVSNDNSNFTSCWCFLFHSVLVVVSAEESSDTTLDNITLDTKLGNLQIFKDAQSLTATAVNPSTLKITNSSSMEYPSEETIYLTESVNNDRSNIIEKWLSALLDEEILFNENDITSTLQMPMILKNLRNDSNSTTTFTSLMTQERMVEISSFLRSSGSVIMRRSFYIDEAKQKDNAESTLLTMMTSISSILSLKREKPKELFIVLQIDFKKITKDQDYLAILNIIKALHLAIPLLNVCLVDTNGYIVRFPIKVNDVSNAESIKNWKFISPTSKLDPKSIKSKIYPLGITANVGVVVISNTTMEEGKSCLFKNYSCFSQDGRHTVNELKIKVGYLNVDYSSKINELLEVDSWDNILETICYSYNISFEDDNDIGSIFTASNTLSSHSIFQNEGEEEEFDDDNKSMMTLQISTPVNLGQNTSNNSREITPISDTNDAVDLSSLNLSIDNSTVEKRTPEELKMDYLQKKRETYSVVLNQIDEAIHDIKNNIDPSVPSVSKRDSLYNYL